MKYAILPLFRLIYVLFILCMVPVFLAFSILVVLWNWKIDFLKAFYEMITFKSPFDEEDLTWRYDTPESIWVHQNAWHYIIDKKTIIRNPNKQINS